MPLIFCANDSGNIERDYLSYMYPRIFVCYLDIQIYRCIFFSTGSACDAFSTASRSFVSCVLLHSGKTVWKMWLGQFFFFVKAKAGIVVNKTNLFLPWAQTHANTHSLISCDWVSSRSYQEKAPQLVLSLVDGAIVLNLCGADLCCIVCFHKKTTKNKP